MITSRENYGHPVFEAKDSRWRSPDSSPGLVIQATFDVSKGSVLTARLKAVLTCKAFDKKKNDFSISLKHIINSFS